MTTKKLEKQKGFEGTENTAMTKDKGDSGKTATNKLQQVLEAMGLLVGKNWRLTSDGLNIIVSRRQVNKKSGMTYWRAEYYYATLVGALHGLIELGIKETQLQDFRAVVDKVETLKSEILQALQGRI